MSVLAEVLADARARYASSPSHAPPSGNPAFGTYCMVTAVHYAALEFGGEGGYRLQEPALRALRAAAGSDELTRWNADHTTAEALAAFDAAVGATS